LPVERQPREQSEAARTTVYAELYLKFW